MNANERNWGEGWFWQPVGWEKAHLPALIHTSMGVHAVPIAAAGVTVNSEEMNRKGAKNAKGLEEWSADGRQWR